MKIYSMIGATIVILALIFYTIAFVKEQRLKKARINVLILFTLGVIFDLTATVFMILGSSHGMLTVHGFIGYSSFVAMLTDTILLWNFNKKNGSEAEVKRGLHIYSRIAYSWWIIAFITGGLLVALR